MDHPGMDDAGVGGPGGQVRTGEAAGDEAQKASSRRKIFCVPRETVAAIRRLYEAGEISQVEIGRRAGVSTRTIRKLARREDWRRPADVATRRALVASLRAKVDRQMRAADRALAEASGEPPAETERMARTLANLVKTMRELLKFDEEQRRAAGGAGASERDDDDALADPDALRAALAERLERLRAGEGS